MTFQQFLRQRQRKTTTSKGQEQFGLQNLDSDLIRVDDWRVRLRWRRRERVHFVHQSEANSGRDFSEARRALGKQLRGDSLAQAANYKGRTRIFRSAQVLRSATVKR